MNIQLDSCTEKEKRKIEISLFIEQSPESPSFKSKAPPLSHFGERIQSIWSYNTYINPLRFVCFYRMVPLRFVQSQPYFGSYTDTRSINFVLKYCLLHNFTAKRNTKFLFSPTPGHTTVNHSHNTSPEVINQYFTPPGFKPKGVVPVSLPPPCSFSLETSDCKKQTRISA